MDILILAAVCFALSIFYSAMEIAYTSFDKIVLEGWKRAGRVGSTAVEYMAVKSDRFLMTTLIGTNLSNVFYATFIVIWAESRGIASIWVMIGSPLIVLIFAELLPKIFGHATANLSVRLGAYPLWISHVLFTPVRLLLRPLAQIGRRKQAAAMLTTERRTVLLRREIDHILSEAEAEGALNEKEGDLIVRYLNARDIRVREVMTPRTKMVALAHTSTVAEAAKTFRESRHNVLPVYEGDLDHIVGCIRSKDLLRPRAGLGELLRPISAVPESKRIVTLLQQFRADDLRLAIVVDEHGGTDGIIGLKDIVAALVGPVSESWDGDRQTIKRIAPGKYLVTGAVNRDELEKASGWRFPEGEFTTLAGWLSDTLGRIPKSGEQVELKGITVRALACSPKRMEAALLSIVQNPDIGTTQNGRT